MFVSSGSVGTAFSPSSVWGPDVSLKRVPCKCPREASFSHEQACDFGHKLESLRGGPETRNFQKHSQDYHLCADGQEALLNVAEDLRGERRTYRPLGTVVHVVGKNCLILGSECFGI